MLTQSYIYQQRAFSQFLRLIEQTFVISGGDDPEWYVTTNCYSCFNYMLAAPFVIADAELFEIFFDSSESTQAIISHYKAFWQNNNYKCPA